MNIRKNINRNLRTALLAMPFLSCGAALLFTGCQDDHFDIVSTQPNGNNTIWQNIQSHPELSEFADILQSVKYSQTEEKTTSETYADIFDGDQAFTVWAPVNGKFNYDYYKQLLATGIRDSIYKVETELIRNSMARYNNPVSGSDSVKLSLFNSKYVWLNNNKKTIKGVEITEPNIGSSNGILHITNGAVAYQPNLYEYLATRTELDSINRFIKGFQTTKFDEQASTPGPTVDGVATWVDSITHIYNEYITEQMNAHLSVEDSNYVMIAPTNKAWDKILEQAKKYYRYKTNAYQQYYYDSQRDGFTRPKAYTLTASQVDSLQTLFAKSAICRNLAFNANWQYRRIPITSIDDIKAADARLDSLRSTSGTKFKKTGTVNKTNLNTSIIEIDNYATMFGNADPAETSNGYVYTVDDFTYPHTIFAPSRYMAAQSCFDASAISEGISVNSDNAILPREKTDHVEIREPIIDEETGKPMIDEETGEELTQVVASRDTTYRFTFLGLTPNDNNTPVVFKLEDVRSCKYDIYAVVVYQYESNIQNRFKATIKYNRENSPATGIPSFTCINLDENAVDADGASLYGTEFFVNKVPELDENLITNYTDTICLAKDFEFPIAYYGIQSLQVNGTNPLVNTYPILEIKTDVPSRNSKYTRALRINAIILKSKEW